MKNFLIIAFTLLVTLFKSQIAQDTILKTQDIETVIISDKDYEKYEISYDLKQNTNTRYLSIVESEIGLKFKNSYKKKGIVSDVILFLHKTEKDRPMTNLEINFYTLDSLTGKPEKKINNRQILYSPKKRSRGKVKINVLNYNIPFSKEGIFASIKWLPTLNNDKNVGPAVRLTAYSEPLTYTRYMDGKWGKKGNIFSKDEKYANVMMGINVYFKKKKNE